MPAIGASSAPSSLLFLAVAPAFRNIAIGTILYTCSVIGIMGSSSRSP
jgi:hypothetical protein